MPAPRMVTPSTSSDNDRSNEYVPAGISITSPGWASSSSSWSVVSWKGATASVVGVVGGGVVEVVASSSAVVSSGAVASSEVVADAAVSSVLLQDATSIAQEA